MNRPASRNDPCPCGSGRKYKHCCAGKMRIGGVRVGGTMWVILGVVVVAVVVGVVMVRRDSGGVVPQAGPVVPSATSGPPGEPWAYDSVSNRHYDPGHGHWHDGPPPPPAARGLTAPAATGPGAAATPPGPAPAAWTHDVANNRHWDPNHNHWHPGPPPPGAK